MSHETCVLDIALRASLTIWMIVLFVHSLLDELVILYTANLKKNVLNMGAVNWVPLSEIKVTETP